YVIGVARFPSADAFGQIVGSPLGGGQAYTLHISLEDHALNPGGSDPVAEVEPNELPFQPPPDLPPPDLSLFAQNGDDADWVVNTDPDLRDTGTFPHVYVRGTGDGTFDYYSFTVTDPGSVVILDFTENTFDLMSAFLYDANGVLLAQAIHVFPSAAIH